MGFHAGLLAVDAEWPTLRPAFDGAFGQFEDGGAVTGPDWFELPDEVDGVNAGTVDGKTYFVDPRMVFTTWDDFIVDLSRSLTYLIVAGGAETVSGTFWFLAADSGSIKRWHWNVLATLTAPLDEGEPLASELSTDFEDPDGLGIVAGFSSLGFDADLFKNPPDGRRLISRVTTFPATGELAARVSRHTEAHQRPNADDWMKSIQAVPRTDGSVDLRARPDQAASEDRGSRRSWVRRLFG